MASSEADYLPTFYNGYHFRSRLEARWAVFFDAMNFPYVYEHQGFNLPTGRFLPDFYVPDIKLWIEVKPHIEVEAVNKCQALSRSGDGGREVLILIGQPWPESFEALSFLNGVLLKRDRDLSSWVDDYPQGRLDWAFRQARSARFEFGETPNPVKLREYIYTKDYKK